MMGDFMQHLDQDKRQWLEERGDDITEMAERGFEMAKREHPGQSDRDLANKAVRDLQRKTYGVGDEGTKHSW
ncbi:hypothetical protein [Streptomyces palmae]|uniref:Uncharacterized protein n=1 Tax=Streptomyces palmae TaxID=1701085 RepID=A0A4Z0FVP0_9ACTN|nr:hypothetical protein [Streptomyces palmae]TGA85624.1 hypothetical protein E4099_30825 [Streptomyces palmae]